MPETPAARVVDFTSKPPAQAPRPSSETVPPRRPEFEDESPTEIAPPPPDRLETLLAGYRRSVDVRPPEPEPPTPPPVRVGGDRVARAVLIGVVIALSGLIGWYLWWRSTTQLP